MSMLLQSTFPRMALTVQTSSKPETRRIRTLGVRAEAGDAVVEGEGTAGVGVAVTTQTRTSRARGSVLLPQSRLQALAFGQSAIKTPSATRGCAVSSHGASNPLVSVSTAQLQKVVDRKLGQSNYLESGNTYMQLRYNNAARETNDR